MRTCAKCGEDKPLAEFSPGHYRCRLCRREDAKDFHRHGLTIEEYQNLLASQGGRCAICGKVPEEVYRFVIDHDHSCCPGTISCGNCVRGILCQKCNTGLGMFEDKTEILLSAIEYLDKGVD